MNDLYETALMVKEAAVAGLPMIQKAQTIIADGGFKANVKQKAIGALNLIKRNPKRVAGALAAAALTAGGVVAYKKHELETAKTAAILMYEDAMEDSECINEKVAFAQDLYDDADLVEKYASEDFDSSRSKTAAEILYNDAMYDSDEVNEKLAFAEQLFAEADWAEKVAEDNGAGEEVYVGAPGEAAANVEAINAKAVPGINAAGIQAAGALDAFVDQHRAARAAE